MRRDLSRRSLPRPAAASARPGDPCPRPGCRGRLTVYHTHVDGDRRVRYLECDVCGGKPADNKQIVPLEFSPRRAKDDR